jgi:hypothetical protein
MPDTYKIINCPQSDTFIHVKKLHFYINFPRREDISKCLYEYRVIVTCYKKLGDLDGC